MATDLSKAFDVRFWFMLKSLLFCLCPVEAGVNHVPANPDVLAGVEVRALALGKMPHRHFIAIRQCDQVGSGEAKVNFFDIGRRDGLHGSAQFAAGHDQP
jgi:hypothetical protein